VDRPLPWLRYVDADDVENRSVEIDGMAVRNAEGEDLGKVEAFIVDASTARPYYVVVDSGGWFKSKHFLLPIGLAHLRPDQSAIVAEGLTRERIARFPGFERQAFEKLGQDDLKRFNDETCAVCSITTVSYAADEPYGKAWERAQYRTPDWWRAQPTLPDRMGERAVTAGVRSDTPPGSRATPSTSRAPDAERLVARDADPSPHFAGRAQPGDILGVETGGERTHVGETAEDENERRKRAERAARKE
jgi:hypothetical protein